jgi:hypothetical protein
MKTRVPLALCLAAVALLTACSTSGIRRLNDVETKYFTDLKTQLQDSSGEMQRVLDKRTAVNEETALREIALLDDNIRRAKVVYSVREVLTAPKQDSAAFIQVTRNKIILYHLAEAGQARNEKLVAELAKGREERKQLISDLGTLNKLVAEVITSNEVLHNHLNRSGTAQLADIIAEVGRQVTAFNEGLKAADQSNAAIQKMVEAGKAADKRVQQADDALFQFIDVWSKLNQQRK